MSEYQCISPAATDIEGTWIAYVASTFGGTSACWG